MSLDIQNLICLGTILISTISIIRIVMQTRSLGEGIRSIISACSTIIAFFIFITFYELLDIRITSILTDKFSAKIGNNMIIHLVVLAVIFIIIKFIVEAILSLVNNFVFSNSLKRIENKGMLIILSTIFGAVRGILILIGIFLSLAIYNNIAKDNLKVNFFENVKAYNIVQKIVDGSKIKNISNGIKEKISSGALVYYNGVTVDEGIKSNESIDNKARELAKNGQTVREKAKNIYTWVGSNITYDDEKARRIVEDNNSEESGSIVTFKNKKGICFDYACLYTSMLKAVGIKSRIVIGKAYNGEEFVSHAWNQVYLSDENKWINVDSTFYSAGDYFDNANFDSEHKQESIAGEF
ncbi:MAG: transglutaminase domain-containing protein [Clostridium sp.]|nr:transglutaminase domain-containing protein [Clostridium sp.]